MNIALIAHDKKKEEILLEGKTDCLEGFGDMTLDCLDRQVHARRDLCIGHTVRPAFLEHFPAFGRQGSHGLPYYPGCILRIDPVMLVNAGQSICLLYRN